jgi:hypothetical protein
MLINLLKPVNTSFFHPEKEAIQRTAIAKKPIIA